MIIRRQRGAFSPEVVAMLQTFAAQSVLAIQNARLFREIQRQKQYSDTLMETSPVAIVTMDLAGAVTAGTPGRSGSSATRPRRRSAAHGGPDRDPRAAAMRSGPISGTTLEGEWIRAIGRRARKDGTRWTWRSRRCR